MYQKHKAKSIKTQNNERKNETFARGPKERLCLYLALPTSANSRVLPSLSCLLTPIQLQLQVQLKLKLKLQQLPVRRQGQRSSSDSSNSSTE